MKNFKSIIASMLIGSTMFMTTGCFGSFGLVKTIYDWNGGVSESGVIKSVIMWVLLIIPVYQICALVDFIIFNLIEFWSGSNPIAMEEGEKETQLTHYKGEDYFFEVTKNQYKITQLTGKHEGRVRILRFDDQNDTWYMQAGDEAEKALMTITQNESGISTARIYTEKGYVDLKSNQLYSNSELAMLFKNADEKFLVVNDR